MGVVDLLARIGRRKYESPLEERLAPVRRRLLDAARGVDRVDMVLGPACALMYLSGDESLQRVAVGLSAAEVVSCKIPYAVAYVRETRDYLTVAAWTAKEIVMNGWIGLAFGDLLPAYSAGARVRFERDYAKAKKASLS